MDILHFSTYAILLSSLDLTLETSTVAIESTRLDEIKNLCIEVQFGLVAARAVCTHMTRFVSPLATWKNWSIIL